MRGQVSFEYLLVVGVVMTIVLAFFGVAWYQQQEAQDTIDEAQLNEIGLAFIEKAEQVYFQGTPARQSLTERLPDGIESIETVRAGDEYILVITPTESSGLSSQSFPSDVPIEFIHSDQDDFYQGINTWTIRATSGAVTITEANNFEFWLRFDDFHRDVIRDYSGSGTVGIYNIGVEGWNDIAAVNPVPIVDGRYGTAAQFTAGTDQEFRGSVPNIPTDRVSVTFWLRQTNGCDSNFRHPFGLFNGHVFTVWVRESGSSCAYHAKVDPVSGGATQPNMATLSKTDAGWHHFAITFDGTNVFTYLNGQQTNTVSFGSPTTLEAVSDTVSIGDDPDSSNDWNGVIDEFRVYGTALSAAAIQEDMNSHYPVPYQTDPRPHVSLSFENEINPSSLAINTKNLVKGKAGGAISFDGIDDFIDFNVADPNGGSQGASIAAYGYWTDFRPDLVDCANNECAIVSKATGILPDEHWLTLSTWVTTNNVPTEGSLRMYSKSSADPATNELIDTGVHMFINNWYHVAGTYDGANMRLYIEGNEIANTIAANPGPIASTVNVPLTVGSNTNGARAMKGVLDEIVISDKVYDDVLISSLLVS